MQIMPICTNINRPTFKGEFGFNDDLNRIMDKASEKDLVEFSLILDVINNTKDNKYFYVKEKKTSAINQDKGFILWGQDHWDSFPKPCRSRIVDNFDDDKQIAPVLGDFTKILASIYNVNFEKNIKTYLQKQITTKLSK